MAGKGCIIRGGGRVGARGRASLMPSLPSWTRYEDARVAGSPPAGTRAPPAASRASSTSVSTAGSTASTFCSVATAAQRPCQLHTVTLNVLVRNRSGPLQRAPTAQQISVDLQRSARVGYIDQQPATMMGRTCGSAKARGGCAQTVRPQHSTGSPSKLWSELGTMLSVDASQSSTTSFASLPDLVPRVRLCHMKISDGLHGSPSQLQVSHLAGRHIQ